MEKLLANRAFFLASQCCSASYYALLIIAKTANSLPLSTILKAGLIHQHLLHNVYLQTAVFYITCTRLTTSNSTEAKGASKCLQDLN